MPDAEVPSSLDVPLPALAHLAVEWWRLHAALSGPGDAAPAAPAPARHALRRIEDFLRQCELEVQSMDGRPFDPGLPVRVIDAVDDPAMAPGEAVIAETLSPMVLWRGRVIRSADVVTRRGSGAE